MHSAKIEKSNRLQRVLKVLWDGKEHTTRDLIKNSGMCAINSIVAEIRANGYSIDCQRRGNRWYYTLVA